MQEEVEERSGTDMVLSRDGPRSGPMPWFVTSILYTVMWADRGQRAGEAYRAEQRPEREWLLRFFSWGIGWGDNHGMETLRSLHEELARTVGERPELAKVLQAWTGCEHLAGELRDELSPERVRMAIARRQCELCSD